MDIELRLESPADYRETENMVREAFWNHYSPGCNEHYLLHIMRKHPTFISELDFVAVSDGKIIGNVVFLKSVIKGDNGRVYDVLSLGPIAVLPEYQGKGVGGKLIGHSQQIARDMGYRAILLCGDPDYYSRQGFVPAERFGIRTSDNMYAVALQVCELYSGALSEASGRYFEDDIYNIDEKAANEFNKGFPPKEMITGTPSQKRFIEIASMRRNAEEK